MLNYFAARISFYRNTCRAFNLNWRQFSVVLLLLLAAMLLEGTGVVLILPILSFIEADGIIDAVNHRSIVWPAIIYIHKIFGVDVSLLTLLSMSFGSFCLSAVFSYLRAIVVDALKFQSMAQTRQQYFSNLVQAELSFIEGASYGTLINEITTEMERAVSFVFSIMTTCFSFLLVLFYISLMVIISTPIILVLCPTVLLSLVLSRYINRLSAEAGRKATLSNKNLVSFFAERLSGARLIKLSGTENTESCKFGNHANFQSKSFFKSHELVARLALTTEVILALNMVLFVFVGFNYLNYDFGQMGLFVASLLRFMPRLRELLQSYQTLKIFRASVDQVLARINEANGFFEKNEGRNSLARLNLGIEFKNVTFSYRDDGQLALQNLSLFIPAGKVTAIVGPSGSGKSTLVDMIPRFITPNSGDVLFDGLSASEFDIEKLRSEIAYCPQEPRMFNVPISEHISYGSKKFSLNSILFAARQSGADKFIEQLPEKYQQKIGENYGNVSGGQKRRIDLARCLHEPKSILIMDEPTGNLDAVTEALFEQVLIQIQALKRQTVVLIGHRLSLCQFADQIVVLENGCVKDFGKHEQLMVSSPWYSGAFLLQNK